MKYNILKSIIIAITVSIGVNLIMFIEGNGFSPLNAVIDTVLAFAVSMILCLLFDKIEKKSK